MIVKSEYRSGVCGVTEECIFAPMELEQISCECYDHGDDVVAEYEVPDGTEIYGLYRNNLYEESFEYILRKYDWNLGLWEKVEGDSAIYGDEDYSALKDRFCAIKMEFDDNGFLYH